MGSIAPRRLRTELSGRGIGECAREAAVRAGKLNRFRYMTRPTGIPQADRLARQPGGWHRARPIDRPISEVFDVLTDLEAYLPDWAKGPTAVHKDTPARTGVGTKLTVAVPVAAIRVRGLYEVTPLAPSRRLSPAGSARVDASDEERSVDHCARSGALGVLFRSSSRAARRA